VLRDPVLQQMIREDRRIDTASSRQWLESLTSNSRKRIVGTQPIEKTVSGFASALGVEPNVVPKRPLWRSLKHEDVYRIDAVAALLDCSSKTVHNYLSKYRRYFLRRYRRDQRHPRRLRVLTNRDIDRLYELAGRPPRVDQHDSLQLEKAWRRERTTAPRKGRKPVKGF
jgi:hypothetical protein